jgi:hypothetical protein
MRTYIINLTNNLIDTHRFEEVDAPNCDHFVLYVKQVLESHEVRRMGPGTLGMILCSLDPGDVPVASMEALTRHVEYHGVMDDTLRQLVAFCLARVIFERIAAGSSDPTPMYRRHRAQVLAG